MVGGDLGMNVIVEPLGKVATSREAPPTGPPVHTTLREIVVPLEEKEYVTVIVSLNVIFGKIGLGVGEGSLMALAAYVGSPAAALNVTEGLPVFR